MLPRPIITAPQPVALRQACALVIPDFTVGDHRNAEAFADLTNCLPVNALGFVAIFFGAAMHHQFSSPGLLHRIGNFNCRASLSQPSALSPSSSKMGRHGFTHRFCATVNQLMIFQQRRPRRRCRSPASTATAAEIDPVRAQLDGTGGVLGQPFRILAQQC